MSIRVRSHWLVVLTPLIFLPMVMDGRTSLAEAVKTAVYLTLLIQFFVIVPHELGHILMARYFGIKKGRLFIGWMFGSWLPADAECFDQLSSGKRLAIFSAGPAINLVAAAVCVMLRDHWHLHSASLTMILEVNLFSGLLNLVPIVPLDGGRIFMELLDMYGVRPSRQLTCIRSMTALAGAVWMIVLIKNGSWLEWVSWLTVAALALYLLMANPLATD